MVCRLALLGTAIAAAAEPARQASEKRWIGTRAPLLMPASLAKICSPRK